MKEYGLFINGEWQQWPDTTIPTSSIRNLTIGDSPVGSRHFNGNLDDIRIYNRALNVIEVWHNYNGIVTTDDNHIAEKIRSLRNCGQRIKNIHELSPFNHRLDTIQAAALRVKLRYLDSWNEARRRSAALYNELLINSELVTPVEDTDSMHVYHVYVVRTPQRDELQAYLQDQGIGTGIHYPSPVHLQPYYANNGFHRGQFPITEKLCDEILSLN